MHSGLLTPTPLATTIKVVLENLVAHRAIPLVLALYFQPQLLPTPVTPSMVGSLLQQVAAH